MFIYVHKNWTRGFPRVVFLFLFFFFFFVFFFFFLFFFIFYLFILFEYSKFPLHSHHFPFGKRGKRKVNKKQNWPETKAIICIHTHSIKWLHSFSIYFPIFLSISIFIFLGIVVEMVWLQRPFLFFFLSFSYLSTPPSCYWRLSRFIFFLLLLHLPSFHYF
jgi:hypothetical protein